MKQKRELKKFAEYLQQRELAESTRYVYQKQAGDFLEYLKTGEITKKTTIGYKQHILEEYKKTSTVNLYLTAVNCYLKYAGYEECTVKLQKQQRRQCPDNILSLSEYSRLLMWAKESGRSKYYCIMRTLALTGIRISELSDCTVEALERGKFTVCNKGKNREIYLPDKLITELRAYCGGECICEGVIFLGNRGKPIGRTSVYKMLRRMAEYIGIPKEKVHPHSFRHLFAVTYMKQYSNLFELADILGHASLETTRIYTVTTAEEKRIRINALQL